MVEFVNAVLKNSFRRAAGGSRERRPFREPRASRLNAEFNFNWRNIICDIPSPQPSPQGAGELGQQTAEPGGAADVQAERDYRQDAKANPGPGALAGDADD